MQRPTGVTAIAILFLSSGVYLLALGTLNRVNPAAVWMGDAGWLLNGVRLALPFPFLLAAVIDLYAGWGLLRLDNWARAVAVVSTGLGFIFLIPAVSIAAVDFRLDLLWSGLHMISRVVILWYLFQSPVQDAFNRKLGRTDDLSIR